MGGGERVGDDLDDDILHRTFVLLGLLGHSSNDEG